MGYFFDILWGGLGVQFMNDSFAVRASVVFLPSNRGALLLTLPYWNSVDDLNYPLQHQSYMNLPIFLALGTTKLSPRIIIGQEKGLFIKDAGFFFFETTPSTMLTTIHWQFWPCAPSPLSGLPMSFMNNPIVKKKWICMWYYVIMIGLVTMSQF